ncbi:hypothetical protein BAE44_0003350, partial [Dichanthelium oligosanthes]
LFKLVKNISSKICSCRSSISPKFVGCFILITEGRVSHKFEEFCFCSKTKRPYRTIRRNGGGGR